MVTIRHIENKGYYNTLLGPTRYATQKAEQIIKFEFDSHFGYALSTLQKIKILI